MAEFPRPLGIEKVLTDIAGGVAAAARELPEGSRSEIGAVALKTARIRVEFEMTNADRHGADSAGVGPVTGMNMLVGLGVATASGETTSRAASRGVIEMEIVAISDPVPRAAKPEPKPATLPGTTTAAPPPELLKTYRAGLPGLAVAVQRRAVVLLDRAQKALDSGDENTAAALLRDVGPLFEPNG